VAPALCILDIWFCKSRKASWIRAIRVIRGLFPVPDGGLKTERFADRKMGEGALGNSRQFAQFASKPFSDSHPGWWEKTGLRRLTCDGYGIEDRKMGN
jgi:hypothetical protein